MATNKQIISIKLALKSLKKRDIKRARIICYSDNIIEDILEFDIEDMLTKNGTLRRFIIDSIEDYDLINVEPI